MNLPLTRRRFLEQVTAGTAALAAGAALGCGSTSRPADAAKASPPSPTPASTEEPAAPTPMSVLILGGTAFLGPEIVEAARARGHRLTLFNRGKTNPHLFDDLEKLVGDRDGQLDALRGRRWDAVIDTSGYVPRVVRMSAELLRDAVEHYVFISTISVYASFATKGMDESAPVATLPEPDSEDVRQHYGALKALCEQAAEEVLPDRVATLRPGLIVGPGDPTGRFTYWPSRIARGGEVLAPGTGADPVQLIDVRDLAEWIVHVVERRHTGVYNALGPAEPLPMRDMLAQIQRAAPAADARLTWVDAEFLAEQGVQPWMDLPAWIPATGDYAGSGLMSNRRAVERGLRFRDVTDTARATLAWLDELGPDQRARVTGAGLPPEREAEVLARWHARPGAAEP